MTATRTARERARAELTREIKEEARRQLAAAGRRRAVAARGRARARAWSPRPSTATYPSRDDLLTALIIDAYDAVGEAAERADRRAAGRRPRGAGSPPATRSAPGRWPTRTSTR